MLLTQFCETPGTRFGFLTAEMHENSLGKKQNMTQKQINTTKEITSELHTLLQNPKTYCFQAQDLASGAHILTLTGKLVLWSLISCFTCFSACRIQITQLPPLTGHFAKLCCCTTHLRSLTGGAMEVQSICVNTRYLFLYCFEIELHLHAHFSPMQGMPFTAAGNTGTKRVQQKRSTSLFSLSVLHKGQTTFLLLFCNSFSREHFL